MNSLLQNKFVRFGLFGLGALIALLVLLFMYMFMNSLAGGHSTGFQASYGLMEPGFGGSYASDLAMEESFMAEAPAMGRAIAGNAELAYYPEPIPPTPTPDGYTSGLERYETTSYNLDARTGERDFTALCDSLDTLKTESDIHFKHLNTSLNNCNARFFVEEGRVAGVVATFDSYADVTVTRNTQSVTRHKEQIDSRSQIVTQQLASVERTLTEAETAFDEIVAFARANRDSETLNSAINNKLRQIDQLTNRKISLTSQLDNMAQQAADLNERLNVVEFSASFSRSNPVQVGKYERQWEQAWENTRDQFTSTLIGVSALFVVFLLNVVQYGLYLLVLIVIARFGWKLVRRIWRL